MVRPACIQIGCDISVSNITMSMIVIIILIIIIIIISIIAVSAALQSYGRVVFACGNGV